MLETLFGSLLRQVSPFALRPLGSTVSLPGGGLSTTVVAHLRTISHAGVTPLSLPPCPPPTLHHRALNSNDCCVWEHLSIFLSCLESSRSGDHWTPPDSTILLVSMGAWAWGSRGCWFWLHWCFRVASAFLGPDQSRDTLDYGSSASISIDCKGFYGSNFQHLHDCETSVRLVCQHRH